MIMNPIFLCCSSIGLCVCPPDKPDHLWQEFVSLGIKQPIETMHSEHIPKILFRDRVLWTFQQNWKKKTTSKLLICNIAMFPEWGTRGATLVNT